MVNLSVIFELISANVNDKQIHDEKLILKRETVKNLNKKTEEITDKIELIQKEILLKVSRIYALVDLVFLL
jgi:hypothetical protein